MARHRTSLVWIPRGLISFYIFSGCRLWRIRIMSNLKLQSSYRSLVMSLPMSRRNWPPNLCSSRKALLRSQLDFGVENYERVLNEWAAMARLAVQ